MSPTPVRPDAHLTYLLAKVEHRLTLRLDRALQAAGLTLVHFSALANIGARPGLSSADLARALLISPQAVGTLIRRLSAAGLITRAQQPRGHSGALHLTAEGARRLDDGERIAVRTEAEDLGALSRAEQRSVFDALTRLLGSLEDA